LPTNTNDVRLVTSHLIDVFFTCMNNRYPLIDRQSFLSRFCNTQNPTHSAVACALAAWMMTYHCAHLFPAPKWDTPMDIRRDWGRYYFHLAQEKAADIFDEASYDNFLCLLFIAQYLMGSREYSHAE